MAIDNTAKLLNHVETALITMDLYYFYILCFNFADHKNAFQLLTVVNSNVGFGCGRKK